MRTQWPSTPNHCPTCPQRRTHSRFWGRLQPRPDPNSQSRNCRMLRREISNPRDIVCTCHPPIHRPHAATGLRSAGSSLPTERTRWPRHGSHIPASPAATESPQTYPSKTILCPCPCLLAARTPGEKSHSIPSTPSPPHSTMRDCRSRRCSRRPDILSFSSCSDRSRRPEYRPSAVEIRCPNQKSCHRGKAQAWQDLPELASLWKHRGPKRDAGRGPGQSFARTANGATCKPTFPHASGDAR